MNFQKHTFIVIICLLCSLLITCKTDKASQKTPSKEAIHNSPPKNKASEDASKNSPSTSAPVQNVNLAEHTLVVQEIIKNEKGVLMGVDFGENIHTVHQRLGMATIEKGEQYYKYEVPMSLELDPTFADVSYHFDNQENINKVELDVYTGDDATAGNLQKEFIKYLNAKYGATNQANSWQNGKVILQETDLQDDPGFVVIWNK